MLAQEWEISTASKLSVLLSSKGESAEWLNDMNQCLWKDYNNKIASVVGEAKVSRQAIDQSSYACNPEVERIRHQIYVSI